MKERLVRFDWAMKKLLRNKANFEILEGFLTVLIGQNISIRNILESESNKQSSDDKYERYGVIDRMGLQHLCGFSDSEQFASQHRQWISDAIENGSNRR